MQGTYQFMSVNLLNHTTKPVNISDELESFFHVLVYYSIRYLNSNCEHVQSWVDNYFHKYLGPGRMLSCGQKSYALEVTGELRTRLLEGPLLFRSPMDFVLDAVLRSLRAHYKVMSHEAAQATPPSPRPEPKSLVEEPRPPAASISSTSKFQNHPKFAQWEAEWDAEIPTDDGPTPEERELAMKVADHKYMLELFARQIWNPRWRGDDRILNVQAPEDASAKKARPPPEPALQAAPTSKRQRTSGPERNVSLPARLHQSTRRTRRQTRTHPVRAKR